MDYGDFLVHVFLDQVRNFYDLEHLWIGARRVEWAAPDPGLNRPGRHRSPVGRNRRRPEQT